LGLVTFAALAAGAVVGSAKATASAAPWWWASGVATGSVLLLVLCLFGALFGSGRRRAAFGGALLAGAIYWLIVFSPIFRDAVGSKLITSRLIRLAEMKWAVQANPAPPNNAVVTSFFPYSLNSTTAPVTYPGNALMGNVINDGTSSTLFLGTTIYSTPTLVLPTVAPPPAEAAHLSTPLQEVAHYLLIWPLALLGGIMAGGMYALARRQRTANS
jgi:hypothetical protein